MLLEYVIVLSIFVLAIGLIGMMVKRGSLSLLMSVIMVAGSILIAFSGFTLFWKNEEGVAAIFVVLTLLIVQVLATLSLFATNKRN